MNEQVKKFLIALVKLLVIIGIFAFLIERAARQDAFTEFLKRDKNWWFLLVGFFFSLAAIVMTLIRWRWLVVALGVKLSLNEALRIGFIGLLFNLSPMGIVGGDVVKTCILGRKYPGTMIKSAASVIVDRVIGLYVMFLIAMIMVFVTGFFHKTQYEARFAVTAVIVLTVAATVCILVLMSPDSQRGMRHRIIRGLPLVGELLDRLTVALQTYRNQKATLFYSCLITFFVHASFSVSLYFIAMGLFDYSPSCLEHFVLYPVANTGSIIPLSAGPLEYFLDTLYPLFEIPGHETYRAGFGMMAGIVFRLAGILVTGVGMIYYLGSRSEISDALKTMDANQDENSQTTQEQ
ncbi:MAG: lysylphosphatidylglycerol synthase transmembrane domain-containing protein [Planctomycetia bacterium]|nr:lysylphosphatidylglycerol synthase transmembrane domain-containing protein [Planctomycetia bacterium]